MSGSAKKPQRAGPKVALSEEGGRRHREAHAVQIRKQQREESVLKRRQLVTSALPSSGSTMPAARIMDNIKQLAVQLAHPDPTMQLDATSSFRKLLSMEKNPPIDGVISCGVVPIFMSFLARNDQPKLQFEAAWALTNIASGTSEHTRAVIDAGAVPVFVSLMRSPSEDVREQAVWALGNIAGDSSDCRDMVMRHGMLQPLLELIHPGAKLVFLRNAAWSLSNLCRGKPAPDWGFVAPALPVLAKLLFAQDPEILTDALWALSYLSEGDNDRQVQRVIELGVTSRIVELLLHASPTVVQPAMRTIGNIATGDDLQTQVAIFHGALPALLALLTSGRRPTRKEACWTLSNITAGNRDQIQAVIDCNMVQAVVQLLSDSDAEVRKEAVWVISNATSGGSAEQIDHIVRCGAIGPLTEMCRAAARSPQRYGSDKLLPVALEGLENILRSGSQKFGAEANPYVGFAEAADVPAMLEELQDSEDEATYHKATDLLRVYFGGTEEGSEVESLMLRGDAHSEAAAAGDGDGGHMMSHDAQHAQHFEFGVAPPGAAQQQLQQPFGASWAGATAPGGGSAAPGPTTSFSFNFQ